MSNNPYRRQGGTPSEPVAAPVTAPAAPPGVLRVELTIRGELVRRFENLCSQVQSAQRAYQDAWSQLDDKARQAAPEPILETREKVFERVFCEGLSAHGHAPNSVLCIRPPADQLPLKKGERLILPIMLLPIGCEIIAMEATAADAPAWDVLDLSFGSMNLISPYGIAVPLQSLLYLTRSDLLMAFSGMKTKVDVQVHIVLVAKQDGATFEGYRLFFYSEEQLCAIQIRIEPVECQHPVECVQPILFADREPCMMSWRSVTRFMPHDSSAAPRPRYRCSICRREVMKVFCGHDECAANLEMARKCPERGWREDG